MRSDMKSKCGRSIIAAIGITVLLVVGLLWNTPHGVLANAAGYVFTPIAFLGDPAPGPEGGTFINDFEPSAINNKGEVLFIADVSTGGEGMFFARRGQILQLGRSGESAPGGGVFDFGVFGPSTLNDEGDAGFVFILSPFSFPFGANSGLYLYSHNTRNVTPVVAPGVTPAPGGGTFTGATFGPSLNNRGALLFVGIVPTDKGIHLPDEDYIGLGEGVFKADKQGNIFPVLVPGDPAPGGGTFDFAFNPWTNDGGDVAFIAHIAGEECHIEGYPPQAELIACLGSLYVKSAATEAIQSIVHQGEPAPGGGVYRQAFSPVMNNRGDIVFLGDLTPSPGAFQTTAVYLHSEGVTVPVARPGDPMPGGGTFVTASNIFGNQVHVNDRREVTFNAVLDTDVNGDGRRDSGQFVWSDGSLRLVARTGTVIPGVGTVDRVTVAQIVFPPSIIPVLSSGAINNDRGQVLFALTLTDGRVVMLVTTPHP